MKGCDFDGQKSMGFSTSKMVGLFTAKVTKEIPKYSTLSVKLKIMHEM
jgi:hypothetical protein